MNIETILAEYDSMFGRCSLKEIEDFLCRKINEAKAAGEYGIVISLLNEIIGFCRDTTQKDKSLGYCRELKELLDSLHMEGRIEYATSMLNIANACRAFGLFEESLRLHESVYESYKKYAKPDDFMYASLFNNWSLLYQEMGDYKKAEEMLLKALAVVDLYEDAAIQQATTRTNLAMTLLQTDSEEAYDRAMAFLREALEVFEKDGGTDFHYGAALVAMGDAYCFKKEYDKAAEYYKKGMAEIEKHVGRTDNYDRVAEKYDYAINHISEKKDDFTGKHESNVKITAENVENIDGRWVKNLERSRDFYEKYGKDMIHRKFPEYEKRMAVGIAGEGSDCFGFDDEISTDHDYEAGFSIWLTEEDYDKIGEELQQEYDKLAAEHGHGADSRTGFLKKRRGVSTINGFYNGILGTDKNYEDIYQPVSTENIHYKDVSDDVTLLDFTAIEEYNLAQAVNGQVFRDDAGIFSRVRNHIKEYYPENIWRQKLAGALHDFSQYAQSNYARMMARKDYVTAKLCVAKGIESSMDIAYLLNKEYAPYYKWKHKGMEGFSKLRDLHSVLEKISELPNQKSAWENVVYNAGIINKEDECICLFEQVAEMILAELKTQNLVSGNDLFLEGYLSQILRGKNMDIIQKIVELEWKQFDKVKNEGGRADCQDNFETFDIMRKSQYMTWNEELLCSYYNDLVAAENKGWNLITEKYARMMKSTAPEKYADLEKNLPVLSDERIAIQEEIIKIQVAWMEEFAKTFPKMAGNARIIHTYEDTPYNTSYETYLRGELGTYSETTFVLYGRFITGLLQEQKNLAFETMNNTAGLYGYKSLEDAEEKM